MPSIKRQEDVAAAEEAAKQQDRLKKAAEERHRFEKRVLALCTGSLVLVTVIWAVALSTDHWYDLAPPPEGVFLSGPRTVLRGGHSGLWKICTEQFHPANVTAYESLTTTVAPVSTTRRPRAQPCKRMGLRGRKRKRCRLFITNRFRFGLSQRRRPSQSQLLPTVTTPRTPDYPDSPDTNLTEWLVADFDDQVSNAADVADNTDEEVALEPVDLEKEKILQMVEEEILERISDGAEDDLTVNETLFEALDEAIDEITSPIFRECRLKELSGGALQDSDLAGWQMLSYMRTLLTFSVVSVLLLVLGFLSALYTFKEPRYTFKRLSAGIQFIAFCGLLVVIQVYRSAAQFEQDDDMGGADMEVGFSQVLAWLALALQLLSSFLFLLYSRKKKRNKAASEELAMVDEPTIIGR